MFENKIAIFGVIFLVLGLVLLFVLFFWLVKRTRIVEKESEKKDYGGLIRGMIFFFSIFFIFFAWLFFQMQDHLRPFSEYSFSEEELPSKKFVAEIRAEPGYDSLLTLTFLYSGKGEKFYREEFEIPEKVKLKLEAEVLNWDEWLSFFGLADGYKLTWGDIFSSDSLQEKINSFELSGGPTNIWKKIYDWRKLLLMVKPEKLKSDIFILNSGETKKVYFKDKKIVVE